MNKSDSKSLDLVTKALMKEFGDGIIFSLADKNPIMDLEVFSTGLASLDIATGVMGFPRGRSILIYGPPSSGKTSLVIKTIATAQKKDPSIKTAFIDVEQALDKTWMETNGVDINNILISQPDHAEQALSVLEAILSTGAVDIIVLDSLAALVPKAELEGKAGDAHVGLQQRLLSQFYRRMNPKIKQTNTLVIMLSQIRSGIGPYAGKLISGGNAPQFYSSMSLEIRKVSSGFVKRDGEVVGQDSHIKIKKNKVAPPLKECDITMLYNSGFSSEFSLLDAAVKMGIIQKSGAWYSYGEDRVGQGRDNSALQLMNPDLYNSVYSDLYNLIYKSNESEYVDAQESNSETSETL